MSATRITVVVLQCDQGMGTLVEVFENVKGTEQLTKLALIDIGSEMQTKVFAEDAVDTVMDSLAKMPSSSRELSLFVLSHQDYDHWSLLPLLQDKIAKKYGTIPVRQFARGGQRWRPGALTAVKLFEQTFHITSTPLPRAFSDYEDPSVAVGQLADLAGVKFRTLAVNAPTSRSADDLIRNGTSAVIVVEFGGTHVVLPGDATADTLGFINDILGAWAKKGKGNPVSPCRLLGAPHHGALRTIASNFTSKTPKLEVGKTFAGYMAAEHVAASAGYLSKFYHPYKAVIDLLATKVGNSGTPHTYVIWNEGTEKWQRVPEPPLFLFSPPTTTTKQIWTTVCTLDDPPVRTHWDFDISAKGELTPRMVVRGGAAGAIPPEGLVARPAAVRAAGVRQSVRAGHPTLS